MSGRPWTGVEILRMRKLASSGVRARDIAQELGRTIEAVRARAVDEVIPLRHPRPSYSDEDIATIKRMARAGHPAASIARAVGRTRWAIHDKCQELQIPLGRSLATNGDRRVRHEPEVWTRICIEAQERGMRPSLLAQMLMRELVLGRHRSDEVDRALARLERTSVESIAPSPPPAPARVLLAMAFAPRLLGSAS